MAGYKRSTLKLRQQNKYRQLQYYPRVVGIWDRVKYQIILIKYEVTGIEDDNFLISNRLPYRIDTACMNAFCTRRLN